jgi:carbamoyltransferase
MPNPGDAGASLGAAALAYGKKLLWKDAFLGHRTEQSLTRTSLQLAEQIVAHLLEHKVCGVAFGRAEFGPRALGNRSLIADPRGPDMKDKVNEIKKRQKFRPFAPAVLEEHAHKYFEPNVITPYMQHVVNGTKITLQTLPAIVHEDGTCRVQTINKFDNTIFRQVLEIWYRETGCPVLLNTSLNIRGEPMVNNVEDAWRFEEKYDVKVFY